MFSNQAHEAQQRSVFPFLLRDADARVQDFRSCRKGQEQYAVEEQAPCHRLLEAGKQQRGKLKNQWEWRNEEFNEGGQGGHPCNTVCVAIQRPVWKAQISWMQSPS